MRLSFGLKHKMKILAVCAVLVLVCCFIKTSSAVTNAALPDPDIRLKVYYTEYTENSDYWVFYAAVNSPPPTDYVEPLRFMTTTSDAATGAGDPNCGFTSTDGTSNDPEVTFIVNKNTGDVIPSTDPIVTAQPPDGPFVTGPCTIQVVTAGSELNFKLQTFTSADTTTQGTYSIVYDITINTAGLAAGRTYPRGVYAVTPPPTPIDLVAPTVTVAFEVVNSGKATVTTIPYGDIFMLKLTVEIEEFNADVDIAGALVHTCMVADNYMMTDAITFIDDAYCSVATGIFSTSEVGTGFERDATLSGYASPTQTYVAFSHPLEAAAVYSKVLSQDSHDLYCKCSLTYCYNDGTGKCGGNHCTAARKKRETSDTAADLQVRTKLRITYDNKLETSEKPQPCAESLLFRATLGTLGTSAVLLFIGIVFSFTSLRRLQNKSKMRGQDFDSCKISGGSRTQLKADSLSSISSTKKNLSY